MKSGFHHLLRLCFRFRSFNAEVLNTSDPALLIPNHTSWLDWMFLIVCLNDNWKFVTSSTTARKSWLHQLIMINRHTFSVDTALPYAVKRMAEYLAGLGAGRALLKYTARFKDSRGNLLAELEGGKAYTGAELADNEYFMSDESIRMGLISYSVSQIGRFVQNQ